MPGLGTSLRAPTPSARTRRWRAAAAGFRRLSTTLPVTGCSASRRNLRARTGKWPAAASGLCRTDRTNAHADLVDSDNRFLTPINGWIWSSLATGLEPAQPAARTAFTSLPTPDAVATSLAAPQALSDSDTDSDSWADAGSRAQAGSEARQPESVRQSLTRRRGSRTR